MDSSVVAQNYFFFPRPMEQENFRRALRADPGPREPLAAENPAPPPPDPLIRPCRQAIIRSIRKYIC